VWLTQSRWNALGWIFGTASISFILANQIISMYGLFHPGYAFERWQVFIVYLIITWLACFVVMFANRALPKLTNIGLFFILLGVFITIMVCAIMPSRTGKGYASNEFVWRDWQNQAGWGSDGLVFCLGMLNGAFAVGTPLVHPPFSPPLPDLSFSNHSTETNMIIRDCVSHLAEELPNPRTNIPKAILAQYAVGFTTAFLYLITIFYAVNDLHTLFTNPWPFPLAELYRQATNSHGGSLGLLLVIFIPTFCTNIGTYITSGRMLWTLGRDDATPFSAWVGKIDGKWGNPFNATLVCGFINTILGCIYIGSSTAFNAFVGSFIVLSSMSYLAFILPNILTRRRHVIKGPFTMPDPVFYIVASIACGYMIVWIPIYCFPFSVPFDTTNMNYASVLVGGITILLGGWYLYIRNRGYVGPRRLVETLENGETTIAGTGGSKA
jgi:choline transport protein